MSERITIAQLEQEIAEVHYRVEDAWDQRNILAWSLLSAWLVGSEIRLWLMRRGVIR